MNLDNITTSKTKFTNKELNIIGKAYEQSFNDKVDMIKNYFGEKSTYVVQQLEIMGIEIENPISNPLCFSESEFEGEINSFLNMIELCDTISSHRFGDELKAAEYIIFNRDLIEKCGFEKNLTSSSYMRLGTNRTTWNAVCENMYEEARENIIRTLRYGFNSISKKQYRGFSNGFSF